MRGVYLPGGRRTELRSLPDPVPGPGQVVLRVRASTICGSDLRAIYREHLGTGAEAYQGVVAGHEPCGEVVDVGPACHTVGVGDRVVVYHISGCGRCADCRRGYQISCSSPLRRAYGWQRDGGHADLLLADERDLVALPPELSYLDGACVACGFGTAYEAVRRAGVNGADTVLVTGLGPVGLATGMLAGAVGARRVIGTDPSPTRRAEALRLGAVVAAVDSADAAGALPEMLGPDGADVAVDCSGAGAAQLLAVRHTRRWGRTVFVGEGGRLTLDVSADVIHRQLTVLGSWVTSLGRMAELLALLPGWGLHPQAVITDTFDLESADAAYRLADGGTAGKVGLVPAA